MSNRRRQVDGSEESPEPSPPAAPPTRPKKCRPRYATCNHRISKDPSRYKKRPPRQVLAEMEVVVSWGRPVDRLRPLYPKGERGRPPIRLERMLGINYYWKLVLRCHSVAEKGNRQPGLKRLLSGRVSDAGRARAVARSVGAGVRKPPKNEPAGQRRAVGRLWGFGRAVVSAGDGFREIGES